MGSGALQRAQFDRAGFAAEFAGDIACKIVCSSRKLFVTERIDKINALSEFAYISSVGETDSLRNSDNNRRFFRQKIFYFFAESFDIKRKFRQIDKIWAQTVLALCKSCRSGQPSGVSSHDLNDRNKPFSIFKAEAVADDFFYRCSDIFCGASVSRSVVCKSKIVVDRLRASDKSGAVTCYNGVIRKFFDRIH